MPYRTGARLAAALACLLMLAAGTAADASSDTWILIDTQTATAEVRRGDESVMRIAGLAFGRGGIAPVHLEGDRTTPLGEYRIRRINRDSRFHVFLGLDYPNLDNLDRAQREGLIDMSTYGELLDFALRRGYLPPDSPLGGHIGLHGLGDADPVIHRRFHWTDGCVAMTDEQIERLLEFVEVGTPVVIR